MALSDTLTIVGMIASALVALAGQAIGLIVYWNGIIAEIRKQFGDELKAQADAHGAAIELLHGRVNNIRKDFVTDQLYQRDLVEMKSGQREILHAIQGLGSSVREKITELEKVNAVQEFRLRSIDDKINGRNVTRASAD